MDVISAADSGIWNVVAIFNWHCIFLIRYDAVVAGTALALAAASIVGGDDGRCVDGDDDNDDDDDDDHDDVFLHPKVLSLCHLLLFICAVLQT